MMIEEYFKVFEREISLFHAVVKFISTFWFFIIASNVSNEHDVENQKTRG
ncbi:hypothetical protein bcere0010_28030 [Bacillus cereus ATCC 4342]|nr:hypothetical protein bcere0010_28030 [Bacillus cereus ATCC 4342]